MPNYILGIDAGTESFRSGIFDEKGRCVSFGVSESVTRHRRPGWGEQSVEAWEYSLVESIQKATTSSGIDPREIEGVGVDGTSCTVVFLDGRGKPLRDAIMWMDIRAVKEASDIARSGDGALKYIGFHERLSPEWFPCKVLWVKRNEPEVYERAETIFEHTDWLIRALTGETTCNINTTTIRWFYNVKEGGLPTTLYETIGLGDVFKKLPKRMLRIGEVASGLSREMAEKTGLREGIPVAGGGADAFMGVIGVNALKPGKLALITGSSQLHIGLSAVELHAPGIFGSFPDAIIPGIEVVEAGQISTGSIIKWFTSNFINAGIEQEASLRGCSIYDVLNQRAAHIEPGSEGLVVLEHWQGNRTPWVDAGSRGVIRGLTLKHTPAHIFKAIMEGVAYGTAVILKRFEEEQFKVDDIIACGGATQSDEWMQINADVTGKTISIPEQQEAVTLGSAIAASKAAGLYASIEEAADAMVRIRKRFAPDWQKNAIYTEFIRQYIATYEALKEESNSLVRFLLEKNK